MYQIFYPYRDDWGEIIFIRRGKMVKGLAIAIKILSRLPKGSYIRTHNGAFVLEKET